MITAITLTSAGTGYTSTPTVTIDGGGFNTPATATATLVGTSLASIPLTSVGSGYTYAPTVQITGGGGSGATATASVTNGVVSALTLTNAGSGYTSAPTITIDLPPANWLTDVPGLTVTASISAGASSVGLIKTGTGVLNLNGSSSNTYTGTTFANEGTILLNDVNGATAIGAASALIIGDGQGGPNADVVRLFGPNQIDPSATVLINNSGLLDLNDLSNTIGSLAFVGGNLSVGTGGTGSLILGGNVTTQPSPYPASITGKGTLNLGGLARTFDVAQGPDPANPDLTIAVPISNDGGNGVGKLGAGTLLIAATSASVYTGPTDVNQGTLIVNGSLLSTGALTVDDGATLGGTGSVGMISVSGGGTVAPGDSPGFLPPPNDLGDGTLTAAAADFSGGGTLAVRLQSNATPGRDLRPARREWHLDLGWDLEPDRRPDRPDRGGLVLQRGHLRVPSRFPVLRAPASTTLRPASD